MIHRRKLIIDNNKLLADSEIVLNTCQKEAFIFELSINRELYESLYPGYKQDQSHVVFYIPEENKQIALRCKLYSNVLIIKGAIQIDCIGSLIATLFFKGINKKITKLGDLSVKVQEPIPTEIYEFDAELEPEEKEVVSHIPAIAPTVQPEQSVDRDKLLIEAILDVKSSVRSISQRYFEEEMATQIGAKWYDGSGVPNNGFGVEGDYYLNTINGDIYKLLNSTWERKGNIRGSKGTPGDRGPMGLTGATGATGPEGKPGQAGPEGKQGIPGAEGPQGIQGRDGKTGPQGPQGEKGERGSKWYDGVGAPTVERGVNGDYYLDLSNEAKGDVYSKYENVWHRIGNISGGGSTGGGDNSGDYATVQFVIDSIDNAVQGKVDKADGMGLSQENFTTDLKTKLENLSDFNEPIPGPPGPPGPEGPQGPPGECKQSDWAETNSSEPTYIRNKPTVPSELGDLTNVNDVNKKNNDLLVFNETTKQWEAQELGTGQVRKALSYNAENDKWQTREVIGGGGETICHGTLDKEITVKGTSAGNIKDGDVLPLGMTFTQLIEKMFVKLIPPTYTKPTISINSTIGLKFEIGSTIKPTIRTVFNKNDGGNVLNHRLLKNNAEVANGSSISDFNDTFILNSNTQFKTEVTYADGPIKNDNLGNPYPQGQIKEGSVNSILTITAARAYWGLPSDSPNEPTAENIRNSQTTGIDLNNNSTITVVAQPSTRTIMFAYPATLRDCTKIRYEELGDDGNKSVFTQKIIQIPDASGLNPVDYRVYYYTSPIPFGSAATFILTV